MTRRTRRNHSPIFKAKVALAALQGDKPLSQLAEQYDLHANQIVDWKKQLQEQAATLFGTQSNVVQLTSSPCTLR
jgi:transposase